ncbi:DMT family transporter [Frateuria aurantia]
MNQGPGTHPRWATIGLVSVTAVWGSTFFMMKDILQRMSTADLLAVRFVIAAIVMVVMFRRSMARLSARSWQQAFVLGLVYGVAQLLQTWGLSRIAPSVSGFVTGTYVIFTPLLATVLFRQRLPAATWLAAILSMGGIGVLALHGWSVDLGLWLTLASAALYALHIVGLGHWSRSGDAMGMASVQILAVAVVCVLATLPSGPRRPPDPQTWIAVLYIALAAGAGAMLAQTWAQTQMSSTRAAVVMTLEPVFGAFFAVVFGSEHASWRMFVGGGMVMAAMYLIELAPQRPGPDPELEHHQL